MDYGKAIRLIRGVKSLSQKELAEIVGLTPSYISRLEAGVRKPTTETLEMMSKKLNVPMHLMILMSSEKEDMKGLPHEMISKLGTGLLGVLLETECAKG